MIPSILVIILIFSSVPFIHKKNNNSLSAMDLAQKTGMGFRTVQRYLSQLQRKNLIKRVGGSKTGYWVVVEQTDYE